MRFYEGEAKLLHRLVQEWCMLQMQKRTPSHVNGRPLSKQEHEMDVRKARELAERVLQAE